MFECKVTVHMPDLLLATDKLAALLCGTAPAAPAPTAPAPVQQPVAIPQATQAPAPQPMPVNPTPVAPVHTSPASPAAAPVATTFNAPTAMPANPVAPPPAPPVAQAPQYTIEAISRAGAALVQAGKMPELQTLLQQFSVQALTQLAPEQYGPFATALRGLGAQI